MASHLGFLCVALALFAGILCGCGGDDQPGPVAPKSPAVIPRGGVPPPKPLIPGEGTFDRCQPGPKGGGYDLWIKAVRCPEARRWILRFLPTFNLTDREGMGRLERGWQCLTQSEGRRGPYHYVCARGPQLIVFASSP